MASIQKFGGVNVKGGKEVRMHTEVTWTVRPTQGFYQVTAGQRGRHHWLCERL